MKFLLDENVEYRLATFLKDLGHDVTAIAHEYPYRLPDDEVLRIAYREQRILLTNDRGDFGKLVFHDHAPHYGIVLFRRIRSGDTTTKQERLLFILSHYADQLHHFLVVTPKRDSFYGRGGQL
jgi:predicted nuclease of predicted toxin-antitoxin system